MNAKPSLTDRQRVLQRIAVGCLVVFVASIVTVVLGDPFWNLYFVSLGLFIALPVGLVTGGLLIRSRRSSRHGMAGALQNAQPIVLRPIPQHTVRARSARRS